MHGVAWCHLSRYSRVSALMNLECVGLWPFAFSHFNTIVLNFCVWFWQIRMRSRGWPSCQHVISQVTHSSVKLHLSVSRPIIWYNFMLSKMLLLSSSSSKGRSWIYSISLLASQYSFGSTLEVWSSFGHTRRWSLSISPVCILCSSCGWRFWWGGGVSQDSRGLYWARSSQLLVFKNICAVFIKTKFYASYAFLTYFLFLLPV
jgi:hypothetical protein